ncbi:MAG: dipeptide/oligopeptide/nickel ABC transporter permease/ATP-binding protein [Actinomycetota bacterium]|nr:dipeptide/oligopeptide/nickel ABC transporter permease/ATP-binding protein [Actinomycetota bacterium]
MGRRTERLRRLWRGATPTTRRLVLAGGVITGIFAVVAVFAPAVAPYGQDQGGLPQLGRPSVDHLFGTTNQRYDVFSRVVFGARLAFQVVLLSTTFALVVGVPLGLVSGYSGRRLDRILVLVMDALYAFPSLLLAIVAAFALRQSVGSGVPAAALSISVIYVPQYFRVVRNHTLAVREEPFVDAARAMGARPVTVITRYIAANVVSSVPVIFTINAADAVLTLAGLGFLGYGGTFRTAEWGYDISVAISDIGTGFWWTSLFPGLAILLLVTALSLLGEGINDVLNPRLRRAGMGTGDPGVRGVPGNLETAALAVITEPPADPADAGDETAVERLPDLAPVAVPATVAAGDSRRGPAVLAVSDLAVTYHTPRGAVRAVDGVSLEVAAGHSLGLVGESGCGKSTLGRAVLGILPKGTEHSGRVVLDGDDLTADAVRWRAARGDRLAIIFQDPATRLDPLMRIEDHFVETIRAHRPTMKPAATRRLGADALAAVGVPPGRARQYPHEFSGGMRQRIMIALAVALEPRVLIADEPTTSLDVLVEAQVLRLLDSLRQRLGIAVVLVTHNLGIVAETCDRVAVMYAGRIVEEGPVPEVFARPRHPYTQGLLRSVISLETTTLVSLPGVPPDLAHPLPGCPFAPRCPLAMATCHEVAPVAAPVGPDGHRAECHLYPGADPTHPGRAWAPAGRRTTLADPPLAGTLA